MKPSAIDTLVQNLKDSMEQYERESKAELAQKAVLAAVLEARDSGLSLDSIRAELVSRGMLVDSKEKKP